MITDNDINNVMNRMLKEKFPKLHGFLRRSYHSTNLYKFRLKKFIEVKEKSAIRRIANEAIVMNDIFNNKFEILNGPFKGMKYINRSSCSTMLPKILGSYEEPIQDWIIEIIAENKYRTILDIGSAEGYYAVGFAWKLPNSKIIAYDIDEDARNNLKELIIVNNVNNIEIKDECTHEELNTKCKPNTLVFCDIEGFEKILLDPRRVSNLINVDLIIEAHDCFVPNITELLIKRFYFTHTIRIIVDYPYRIKKYSTPQKPTDKQYHYIIDEERPNYMKFIYLKSNYEKI
jgi:hypothetical protein